jgi:hypothetical protein
MNENTKSFAALNSNLLEKLAADLLFVQGHTQIRRTGGPGDGGRDIHSLDPEKKLHLTQCKYHQDSDLACSSSDLSELPMAMIKLGYSRGLFLTNARISPQGKREYLNDYPDLRLDFLEGEALEREVLGNGMLTALWYEGRRFSEVSVSTVFPTIIRRHEGDRPFMPFRSSQEPDLVPLLDYLANRHGSYKFSISRGTTSSEPFIPYRAPEPLTTEEGAMPFLQVMEIAALGEIALPDLPTLAEDICKGSINWLLPEFGGLSVRVGSPSIIPLEGSNSGSRILSNIGATSFTATQAFCGKEKPWFAARPNSYWSIQSDARVSEADWIRLYSEDLDCCLAYEIHSRISSSARFWQEALREIQLSGWQRSLFCLLPKWESWPYPEIPEPDETVEWSWDKRMLCGWLHWTVLGNPVTIRSGEDPTMESPEDRECRERLSEIEIYLNTVPDAKLLDATEARHMVALAGGDPFPAIGFRTIDTADVVVNLGILPSPIRPASRMFELSIAWRSKIAVADAKASIAKAISEFDSEFFGMQAIESWEEYLFFRIDITPEKIEELPTEALLNDFFNRLRVFLPLLTRYLEEHGKAELATKQLWAERFDVNFGISYEQSDKLYVGTIEADGSITKKIDAKSWLENGFPKSSG